MKFCTIGIIGFGEAGRALAKGIINQVDKLIIFDVQKLQDVPEKIQIADNLEKMALQANLILSCIWPGAALKMAQELACYLTPKHVYCDLNNISPQTTISIQQMVENTGASFIKGAVMSPIVEKGALVPILLGGKSAQSISTDLQEMGLNVVYDSSEPQVPAATKILRSILLKGIVALAYETYWAAESFGVGRKVLASGFKALSENPLNVTVENWMNSTLIHAERRAQELGEAELTLREAGIDPMMTEAAKLLFKEVAAKVASKQMIPESFTEL